MKKTKLLSDLQDFLEDLDEILPPEEEFLKSKVAQYSTSMLILNITQSGIDLANEVISLKKLGYPENYRDIFRLLQEKGIISLSLSKKMQDLVGLRNLLAHEYGTINLELLYEQAKDIRFVEDFIKKMVPYLG